MWSFSSFTTAVNNNLVETKTTLPLVLVLLVAVVFSLGSGILWFAVAVRSFLQHYSVLLYTEYTLQQTEVADGRCGVLPL